MRAETGPRRSRVAERVRVLQTKVGGRDVCGRIPELLKVQEELNPVGIRPLGPSCLLPSAMEKRQQQNGEEHRLWTRSPGFKSRLFVTNKLRGTGQVV